VFKKSITNRILISFIIITISGSLAYSRCTQDNNFASLWKDDFAIIILQGNDITLVNTARDYIISQGGKVAILVPPHIMLGWIPREIIQRLIGELGIEQISYSPLDIQSFKYQDYDSLAAVNFFNSFISGQLKKEEEKITQLIESKPLINDALDHPPLNYDEFFSNLPKGVAPSPGGSDSMTGIVAVALFFIESDGTIDPNYYTWTTLDRDNTYNNAVMGLTWWSNEASSEGYNLTFNIAWKRNFIG